MADILIGLIAVLGLIIYVCGHVMIMVADTKRGTDAGQALFWFGFLLMIAMVLSIVMKYKP